MGGRRKRRINSKKILIVDNNLHNEIEGGNIPGEEKIDSEENTIVAGRTFIKIGL